MKTKKNKVIVLMTIVFLLGIYTLRLLPYRNELYVLHDEFAYWAIAANYGGYSWNSMMADSSYYSMGYSFFLVPLFKYGLDAAIMYKCAIIFNAFLVICSYYLSYIIGKKLFNEQKDYEIAIICGVIFIWPFVTMQTNYAWTEILLVFMFWLVTFLLYKFAETKRMIWAICLGVVNVLMFFVHQRTIGILISCLVVMIVIIIHNKDTLKMNTLLGMVLCVILCAFVWIVLTRLKKYNLDVIFSPNEYVDANDFSGQTSKIKSLFSIAGIVNFVFSIIGKVYYFGVSTLLIGPLAIFFIMKNIIKKKCEVKELEKADFVQFFLLLSFGAMLLITSIFMIRNYVAEEINMRIDNLFYGRYFECTIGPLLLIGLCNLKREKVKYTTIYGMMICFLIVSAVTANLARKVKSIGMVDLNTSGFNYFYLLSDDYQTAVLYGAKFSCVIFFVVIIFMNMKKNKVGYVFALLLIGVIWIKETQQNDMLIKSRELENEKYVYSTVQKLKQMDDFEGVTYTYSKTDKNMFARYAFYIQYNLYEKEMGKLEINSLDNYILDEDIIYLVMQDSSLMKEFEERCELIYKNDRINLFGLKDNAE